MHRACVAVEEGVRQVMDKLPNFKPHLIQHPLSLIALVVVAVLVVAAFWLLGLPPALVISLIILFVLIGVASIVALVKYPQLRMEDEHLLNYTRDQFRGFSGDVSQSSPSQQAGGTEGAQEGSDEDLDALRVEEYEQNRGLFTSA